MRPVVKTSQIIVVICRWCFCLNWRHSIFWIALIVVFSAISGRKAEACVWIRSPIEYRIEHSDFVVRGEIIEADAINQNGVLSVGEYLVGGTGPTHLRIVQNSPAQIVAYNRDLYLNVPCGTFDINIQVGDRGLFFLYRHQDGSYRIMFGEFYDFPTDSSTVIVRYDDEGEDVEQDFTEAEVLELLAEKSAAMPMQPDQESLYPFHAPLLVTTDKKSAYMVPVDGEVPVLLAENVSHVISAHFFVGLFIENSLRIIDRRAFNDPNQGNSVLDIQLHDCFDFRCVGFSPGGMFIGQIIEDGFKFCLFIELRDYSGCSNLLQGQIFDFIFSPTDTAVAIWRENILDIYLIEKGDFRSRSSYPLNLVLIGSIPLELNDLTTSEIVAGEAVWSHDGHTLIYTDMAGLWRWDVFTDDSQPTLIIPVASDGVLPFARSLSPREHYMSIMRDEQLNTLELATGRILPNGIVSPDDRKLAYVNVGDDGTQTLLICDLLTDDCDDGRSYYETQEFVWLSPDRYLNFACVNLDANYPCQILTNYGEYWYSDLCMTVGNESFWLPGEGAMVWFYGMDFDFDPFSQEIVVLNNSTTISIGYTPLGWHNNLSRCDDYATLNFATFLDGDVESVQWLPSVFATSQ